jgi:hypothetical protein
MALPALITVSGLSGEYGDGNGLYFLYGTEYYDTSWNYVISHNGTRWTFRSPDYVIFAVSEPCASTVTPVEATWGMTFPVTSVTITSGEALDGTYSDDGADYWVREDDAYVVLWSGTRWELYDNNTWDLMAYTVSATTSDIETIDGATWTLGLSSDVNRTEQYPAFVATDIAIASPDELQAIGLSSDTLAGNYIQINDIDMNVSPYNSGAGFNPIGTSAAPFKGTYNGQDYTIRNLYINRPTLDYVGLFGRIANTTAVAGVWNVRLENATVTGRDYTGSLYGLNANTTETCYLSNITVVGRDFTGAIGVTAAKTYSASDRCREVTVENASVTGRATVGLLAAQFNISADDCRAIGTNTLTVLTHTAARVAGGVGATVNSGSFARLSAVGTITVALPTGAVETNVGGFGGRAHNAVYEDCFARVTLNLASGSWPAATYLGDFTGRPVTTPSTWRRCYAVGNRDVFFGDTVVSGSAVEGCYFQGTDDKNDQGATGKAQAKMKDPATFIGWNFRTLWNIDETDLINAGYPYVDTRKAPPVSSPGLYRSLHRSLYRKR